MAKSRSAPAASAGKGQLVAVLAVFMVVVVVSWGVILALGLRPQLGLDLRGGTSITMIPAEGQVIDEEILDQTVQVIRQRVDAIGVAEPDVARQGDTVLIQLPGVADQEQALEIVGQTAVLQFRRVLEVVPPGTENYETVGPPCDESQYVGPPPEEEEVVLCERARDPAGDDLPTEEWTKYRAGPAEIRGERVTDASAQLDQSGFGGYEVALQFDSDGASQFRQVTGELACEPVGSPLRLFAIVLDDVIESAPQISPDVPCGQGIGSDAIITVGGAQDDARQLALVLRTGALPIQLEFATAQSVSPTLGEASLTAGLQAGVIGLVLVGLYLLALYRGMGLAAIAELGMFGVIVYGLIIALGETIGFTLTLAGIAGIIVSVGIAADSSIIYRERYRDEIKAGRTVRTAADVAFRKAWRTNLTGNTVSFLAALVLYVLAVGPVRGFAFTLGLSTLIDTLLFGTFTRSLFGLVARNPRLARSRWMGLRVEDVSPTLAGDVDAAPERTPAEQRTGGAS
jgi:protein-export membrane protein SecD